MEAKLSDHKRKFQLDRLIFFSDAVFAIAITILILEIKIPQIPHNEVTNKLLTQSILDLIPKFAGFIVSFFLIGLFWTIHHRLFGYVTDFDDTLIRLNLFYLFFIVIMPFTTGFYSEYIFSYKIIPMMIYCFNIIMIGLLNVLLLYHVSNPKKKLSEGLENKYLRRYYYFRSTTLSIIFTLIALVYLFNPRLAVNVPLVIPFIILPMKKYFEKKLKNDTTKD